MRIEVRQSNRKLLNSPFTLCEEVEKGTVCLFFFLMMRPPRDALRVDDPSRPMEGVQAKSPFAIIEEGDQLHGISTLGIYQCVSTKNKIFS